MLFTKEELGAINIVIQSENDRPRVYDLATRRVAEAIFDKIIATAQNEMFVDAEIELSTQEKAFIITCIPEKQTIADGKLFDKLLLKLQ